MVRLTLIARVTDGLPLAEGLESDKSSDVEQYKQQAKVRASCRHCLLCSENHPLKETPASLGNRPCLCGS